MNAESKRACPGNPVAGSSGELDLSRQSAADLQAATHPQLQITRLAMRLTKSEARELIEDLFQRHRGLRQELTQSETEVRK